MDFSAAFDKVSHRGLLYKLRSMSFGGQFLFILSESLSDRQQRMCLNGKISASVGVGSRVPQGSNLGSLLFILYTSELYHLIRNHIVDYVYDSTSSCHL